MNEPLLETPAERPVHLHLVEKTAEARTPSEPSNLGSFLLAFGALAFAGGHGVFLVLALTQLERIPNVAELGGPLNALVIGGFGLSTPLALGALWSRRRLLAWPPPRLRWAARLTALAVAGLFALYLRKMVLGG